jgi:hypothetical protein
MLLLTPSSRPEQHDMHSMAQTDRNEPAAVCDVKSAAKRLADRQESEFNHHLAGLFVGVAGILILSGRALGSRWSLVRYAWPSCFIAAGFFVLIFSDTEMWPFGPQNPWYAITHEPEDLQHKIFAVILLAVGFVELQRVRQRWKAPWISWFFPLVGALGAILLLFHAHSGDMQAPHAMETMETIQRQHRWFATAGLGVAVSYGLAETPQRWQHAFAKVWPALLIVLGVLLVGYTER